MEGPVKTGMTIEVEETFGPWMINRRSTKPRLPRRTEHREGQRLTSGTGNKIAKEISIEQKSRFSALGDLEEESDLLAEDLLRHFPPKNGELRTDKRPMSQDKKKVSDGGSHEIRKEVGSKLGPKNRFEYQPKKKGSKPILTLMDRPDDKIGPNDTLGLTDTLDQISTKNIPAQTLNGSSLGIGPLNKVDQHMNQGKSSATKSKGQHTHIVFQGCINNPNQMMKLKHIGNPIILPEEHHQPDPTTTSNHDASLLHSPKPPDQEGIIMKEAADYMVSQDTMVFETQFEFRSDK
ncbi:hypothetical protein QN277_027486 [Acacia crassicarpa]|uniref:Uncharacterized protein n=1 Tax=Acacia crassicarpa TaxID=499986 RepID=A0AAE1MN23_9FABA|nr:hypothetical protein QN277_027486 [Acacia crassicarpa]